MHKEIAKCNCKVLLKKVKQQWGIYTLDQIDETLKPYDENEKYLHILHKHKRENERSLDN